MWSGERCIEWVCKNIPNPNRLIEVIEWKLNWYKEQNTDEMDDSEIQDIIGNYENLEGILVECKKFIM